MTGIGKRIANKYNAYLEGGEIALGLFSKKINALKTRTGVIVMYHGIDTTNNIFYNFRNIGVDIFRRHLKFYNKHFLPVSVNTFFEATRSGRQYSKPLVALTFDDGLLNNFTLAAPLLEQYKVPASFYVTGLKKDGYDVIWPDFLCVASRYYKGRPLEINGVRYLADTRNLRADFYSDAGASLSDYMRTVDFGEKTNVMNRIRALSPNIAQDMEKCRLYWELADDAVLQKYQQSRYVTIGSHAWYHNNLSNTPPEMAGLELSRSKNYLENLMQKEVNEIAYPDGSYNNQVKELALQTGFSCQLAVNYRCEDDREDPHVLSRIGLYAYQPFHQQMMSVLNYVNL